MITSRIFRAFACSALAILGCVAALVTTASAQAGAKDQSVIAQGRRTGSNLPRIAPRHAVVERGKRAARRGHHTKHRRHIQKRHPGTAGAGAGETGTGSGGNSTSGTGTSEPGTGTGKKGTTTKPVTETPTTSPVVTTPPPVVPAPPVVTPPVEAPSAVATQSTHCFASPHLCGFPDSTNSGVPAGTTLTPSGSLTITHAGTVVNGLAVTGTIEVLANNVTIENTRVTQNTTCGTRTTCGNFAIRINEGVSGTMIRHVETASLPGDTCEHDIRNTGGSTTIEASYLHGCDSNVYTVGPTVLKDSYGIGALAISEDHVENIYFNETSFSAIHDTLINPVEQTAVIFGNSGGGTDVTNCSNQLTVLESLIAGGGYSLYPCAHASQAGTSTLNVQGNHFARCLSAETYIPNGGSHPCVSGADANGYYPKSGSYGLATNYFNGVGTWRGNVWDDNLAKVCITGSSSGCE